MTTLSGAALADNVVVANQYATTPWSPAAGINTFIRDTGAARTGPLLINSNPLGSMAPGDIITGFSFRMWNGATSTFTGANWADYEIRVGGSDITNPANSFLEAVATTG